MVVMKIQNADLEQGKPVPCLAQPQTPVREEATVRPGSSLPTS